MSWYGRDVDFNSSEIQILRMYFREDFQEATRVTYWDNKLIKLEYSNRRASYIEIPTRAIVSLRNNTGDCDVAECDEQWRQLFSKMLRWKMKRDFITQTELSLMTGIPQRTISSYMVAEANPSFVNVMKIANAFDLPIEAFSELYDG